MGKRHLRLVWPQWQGAGSSSIATFQEDLPFDVLRRGYATGTAVLEAVLPPNDGPTAFVPIDSNQESLAERDGVEAKDAVIEGLQAALALIAEHDPYRITTLGGDCSVSVAPFAALAEKYGDDLAVIWIDSHPDTDTGETTYNGYHAMAVSALTGHGDQDVVDLLPATIPASRVALVGVHSWEDDAHQNVGEWGIAEFSPRSLRENSNALLDWLASTGASKVAIHFDVDTVDAAENRFGLGTDFGGLTSDEVKRIITDLEDASEVVGFTIAEYIPRQVLSLLQVLKGMPLLD